MSKRFLNFWDRHTVYMPEWSIYAFIKSLEYMEDVYYLSV